MQNNHVYVEDNGKDTVCVYDDDGRINPERVFRYTNGNNRHDARRKAETFAAAQSGRLHCGWGCNYEGRRV